MAIDVELNTITSGYNLSKINNNFAAIDTALQDGLSRSGNGPNSMNADLDMNGNDVLNVGNITLDGGDTLQSLVTRAEDAAVAAELSEINAAASEANTNADAIATAADRATVAADKVTVATNTATVTTLASQVATNAAQVSSDRTAVAEDKVDAEAAAVNAITAQAAAEAARDAALASYDSFDDRYLGVKASDPTVDNDGNALTAGQLYYNSADQVLKLYNGSTWGAAYVSAAGVLMAVNNLSDLTNTTSARSNLGLGTAATQNTTAFATAAQGATADTAVQPARTVSAGTGLTGGGDLSANRTISADIASQAEAEAGSSSTKLMTPARTAQAITALTSSKDDYARYQELLNSITLRRIIGTQGGTGLVNGHVDAYLSNTIGTASTGEAYDGTGKQYKSYVAGASVDAGYASFVAGNADIIEVDGGYTLTNGLTVVSLSYYSTVAYSGALKVVLDNGGGSFTVVASKAITHAGGGWQSVTLDTPYVIPGSGTYRVAQWNGGGVNVTMSNTATGAYFLNSAVDVNGTFGASFGGAAVRPVTRATYADVASDMTLQGASIAAVSIPGTAWFVALVDPVNTVTYNTDYVASVTNNNSTYNNITLTNIGSYDGTYDILVGKVTLTGGGTSMNYRKMVSNGKKVNDAGVAYMWG
jgi:hypothetical protein